MSTEKDRSEKARLHSRNKNRERYDLNALIIANPELKAHVLPNKFGTESIDFSNPISVKTLNRALLNHYYGIKYWDFPDENLCPPIPGRADYIHYMADLLAENNNGKIPTGDKIICLDVGVGASCIYPIIGVSEYDWKFIGSDIDSKSIKSAQNIVDSNPQLKDKIDLRLQKKSINVFKALIAKEENIEVSVCNPPFYSSMLIAQKENQRKVRNLSGKKVESAKRNFAGINTELICEGGEYKFIQNMISESKQYSANCFWFSTIVSRYENLKGIYKSLENIEAKEVKTIPMGTSNKSSRVIAWTFLSNEQQKEWRETRWEAQ